MYFKNTSCKEQMKILKNRKMISYLLIVFMVVTYALPNSLVKAKENKISGQCGPTAYFQLEKDGTLRITGSGYIDINQFQDLQDAHLEDKTIRIVLEKDIKNVPDEIFKNYTKVVEVELPNHLETIGKNSFANCTALKEIILPRWLKTVDDYAFFNCTSLESVYMLLCTYTKSYTNYEAGTISDYAFYGCNNIKVVLTGVSQPSKMPQQWPETIEKAYGNKRCKIWQYTGENVEKIKLSAASTPSDSINYVIFGDELSIINNEGVIDTEISCNSKKVIVCGDITAIEEGGFKNYTNLEEIYLPESIERIEYGAFRDDSKLKEITIPSKVPKIENHTFDNCSELTTMTIKNPNIELAKKGMPVNLKTIYGFKGSTAETYAKENGIDFISIDLDYENNDGETETSATTTGTNSDGTTGVTDSTTETSSDVSTGTTETKSNISTGATESGESETSTTKDNTPVKPTVTTENRTSNISTTENIESQTTPEITTTDKNVEPTESQTTPVVTTTDKNAESQTTSVSATTSKKLGSQTTSGSNNTETTKGPFDITPSGKFRIKSVKELNYHSVKLSWKKIKNGNSYKIYKAQKDGQFKLIGKTKSNIFIDSKVKPDKTYFYTIQATGKNNKVTWSVIWSTYVRGVPKKPKLTLRKSKTIWILSWGVIKDNSKGVEVYMRKGTQGKFKKVKTIKNIKKSKKKKGATGMTADVSRLKSKGTYFFKIRTYAIVNGRKIHSRWSKTRKVKK